MRKMILIAAAFAAAIASAARAERLTDAPLVDPAWLTGHLGNESLVVIDVRDPVENVSAYDAGHVPGALSAPYESFGWRAEVNGVPGMLPPEEQIAGLIGSLGVDADTHVVVVSQGSDSSEFGKATRVYWTFKVLGHDAVSILDGGHLAWAAAGGEISTDPAAAEPATFASAFRPELLATTEEVEAALADGTPLVDGRPEAQFRGEAKSPVVRAAGTIPGSVNIDQGQFYNGSFVGSDTIARLSAAAGLAPEEPAIAFCNTGHWASIAWFGLSEVGGNQNVSMYDGSMAEWAADESRPIQ